MRIGTKSFVILSLLALGIAGCASDKAPAQQRVEDTAGAINAAIDEIKTGRTQLDGVLNSLQRLQTPDADVKATYATLKTQVTEMNETAKKIADRSADMRAKAAEYRGKWLKESQSYADPDLKKAGEERAEAVREQFSKIAELGVKARDAYKPFETQLNDVVSYLANDLSPAAATAAKPVLARASEQGTNLAGTLDSLIAEMTKVSTGLVPPPPAK